MAASNIRIKKICQWCGVEFEAQKVSTKYCSHRCANLAYKQAVRDKRVKQAENETHYVKTEKPVENIKDKEYLSIAQAATLLGLSLQAVYKMIYAGHLLAYKLSSRLSFVKRTDIDAMLKANPYEKRQPRDAIAITDLYTTAEIKEKFGVEESWINEIAKEHNIPRTFNRGRTSWSKKHIDSYFAKKAPDASITEWYSIAELQEKFGFLDKNKQKVDFLEKIEWKEVKKEYLTLDEVKQLAATPCRIPVLKQASLFACMTGLRISDILKLQWSDFEMGPDQGYYIRICTEKTETESTLPISHEALELCGEWGKGLVFKGLPRAMTHHPLKQWIAEAGIRKKITFHCVRHSYAVIQISLGTDIYTVSKMLTHKNVTTTQIYADLVNSKKRETANKISLK